MKQYQVIFHPEHGYKVISTNSKDYPDYMMTGWGVSFAGNYRECMEYFEMVDELAAA